MHYLGPLQSHRDAVEEDECKDDVVEELMGDNGLAQQPEPDKRGGQREEGDMWQDLFKKCQRLKIFQFLSKKDAPSRYPTMLTGKRKYPEYIL